MHLDREGTQSFYILDDRLCYGHYSHRLLQLSVSSVRKRQLTKLTTCGVTPSTSALSCCAMIKLAMKSTLFLWSSAHRDDVADQPCYIHLLRDSLAVSYRVSLATHGWLTCPVVAARFV